MRTVSLFALTLGMVASQGCNLPSSAPFQGVNTPPSPPTAAPVPSSARTPFPGTAQTMVPVATPVQGPATRIVVFSAPGAARVSGTPLSVAIPVAAVPASRSSAALPVATPCLSTQAPAAATLSTPISSAPSAASTGVVYAPVSSALISGGEPPAQPPSYRSPAPYRKYVKTLSIPVPGGREIPDNQLIECVFTRNIVPAKLAVGGTFTVAVEDSGTASFGSSVEVTAFTEGTLVEFEVTGKSGSGAITCRAKAILVSRNRTTDLAIPVVTASLLAPNQAGPSLNNRFEVARRGSEFGAKVGQIVGGGANGYFWGDALSGLVGYAIGRERENAVGTSFVSKPVAQGTPCVVRINRRVLF